jgi:hypothetical protein
MPFLDDGPRIFTEEFHTDSPLDNILGARALYIVSVAICLAGALACVLVTSEVVLSVPTLSARSARTWAATLFLATVLAFIPKAIDNFIPTDSDESALGPLALVELVSAGCFLLLAPIGLFRCVILRYTNIDHRWRWLPAVILASFAALAAPMIMYTIKSVSKDISGSLGRHSKDMGKWYSETFHAPIFSQIVFRPRGGACHAVRDTASCVVIAELKSGKTQLLELQGPQVTVKRAGESWTYVGMPVALADDPLRRVARFEAGVPVALQLKFDRRHCDQIAKLRSELDDVDELPSLWLTFNDVLEAGEDRLSSLAPRELGPWTLGSVDIDEILAMCPGQKP